MTSTLRRAGGFAAVGTLSLGAPALGVAAAAPFAAIAVLAAFVISEGPIFELFARPGDRQDGRLNGLAGFALAATGLALLATVPRVSMPLSVFVASVLLLAYGNLGTQLVSATLDAEGPFRSVAGFGFVGFLAGLLGQVAVTYTTGGVLAVPQFAFLAGTGTLVAALLREVLYERDDPLVMLSVGLLLWAFDALATGVGALEIGVALVVTVLLGYLSFALGTASVPGMLTGVLLGVLTIVLGGFGWFAVLIAFFGIGGLSAKFRYEEKRERGVAEENEGARGSSNVLGNAAVALVAVVAFAATPHIPAPVDEAAFSYAFAGSVAAAMSDTLSSEIGGLFENPRLITSFEPVPPGTDGGVTWQGEVAGVAGAALVGGIALVALPLPAMGAAVVVLGGVVGMTVDSLLGATLEGDRIGNEAVNFAATLVGALVSAGVALAVV